MNSGNWILMSNMLPPTSDDGSYEIVVIVANDPPKVLKAEYFNGEEFENFSNELVHKRTVVAWRFA